MELSHCECDRTTKPSTTDISLSTSTTKKQNGWNILLDSETHQGLEKLCKYFNLPKKYMLRQLVSEKIDILGFENPITKNNHSKSGAKKKGVTDTK